MLGGMGEGRGRKCPMGVTSTLMGGFKKNHVTWDGGGAPSTMGTLVIIDPKVLGLEKPNTSYHILTLLITFLHFIRHYLKKDFE